MLLDSVRFWDIQNKQGLGKGYQHLSWPWLFWISQKPHPIILFIMCTCSSWNTHTHPPSRKFIGNSKEVWGFKGLKEQSLSEEKNKKLCRKAWTDIFWNSTIWIIPHSLYCTTENIQCHICMLNTLKCILHCVLLAME